ncbi:DNA translocase FtsK domain protein [Neisseria meningitidis 2001072]|nr:DNA translocase FtsK domain protein [Neisseria meningitidis 2001072]
MPSKRQCIGCSSVSSVSAETIWRTNPNRIGLFRLLLQTVRMFRTHPTDIQTVETGRKKRKRKQQKLRRKRLPIRKTLQLP